MNTLDLICNALNTNDAFTNGLSFQNATIDANKVQFTYPAPVIGGACLGTITVHDDGRIFDDTSDQEFVNFDQWLADLNSMMEGI